MAPVGRFAPPLLLMAVIYWLSDQPDLSSGLGTADLYLRKAAHMTEYGLLWFLLLRALGYRRPGLAAVLAIAYAGTDEWHQSFVEGRNGTPVDVLIDATGVLLAWGLWTRRRRVATAWARRRDRGPGSA